jgi:hypothetical protein
MGFSVLREWARGLRARAPRLAGPACVMIFFLAHCAIFMSYPDINGRRFAWGHLPLDDSWIHLSYAKNLLRCGYFTYNPGEIETGATSPLWALVLAAFCPLFGSLYPLTQIYQLEEDTRRGDRTLAVRLGARRSLDVAIAAALVAFALLAAAGVHAGWALARGDAARWAVLAVAAAVWGLVLVPWRLHVAQRSPAEHQRGMYWALGAWAVTDLAVAASWAT